MEQRKSTGRPPTYVLSAEDLGVLNMPGNTLATMVAHLRCKYPNITERIVQSLRTKRIPSAVRVDLRVPIAHGSREHATTAAAPAERRWANDLFGPIYRGTPIHITGHCSWCHQPA